MLTKEEKSSARKITRLVRLVGAEHVNEWWVRQQVKHWLEHGFRAPWIVHRVKADLKSRRKSG